MFDVKKLDRYNMKVVCGWVSPDRRVNGEWVRYADVLEMVVDAMNHRPGACPKCGGTNAVTMFVPTGVVYTVDRAWGFKPYRPADLSEDGMSVQATEDHILHSCPCGWKWVEPCKDAPVEVAHA